jgi:hypothetical protein
MVAPASFLIYNSFILNLREIAVPAKVVHLNLRLPPELHERLTTWARAEHRSLHSQVLHVLTDALEKEGRQKARSAKTSADDE